LWKKMTIPCENGLVYLARLRVLQTPWFGVYVHDIYEPDGDRHPHNHPWSFISIVLRGSYTERLHPLPTNDLERSLLRSYGRWSAHRMGRTSAHRIVRCSPGLKTLILVGPRKANWGFFTENGYVPWQTYEKRCNVTEIEPGVRECTTHRVKWDAPVEQCPRQGEEAARW
jgi:hypothetical protein